MPAVKGGTRRFDISFAHVARTSELKAFRADPEVQEALQAARVPELSQPTLGQGETFNELLQDRSAFEEFDIDRARTQGYGFARLQRLACAAAGILKDDRVCVELSYAVSSHPGRHELDLSPDLISQIEHFFVSYNAAKGKRFTVKGQFGRRRAHALVNEAIVGRKR